MAYLSTLWETFGVAHSSQGAMILVLLMPGDAMIGLLVQWSYRAETYGAAIGVAMASDSDTQYIDNMAVTKCAYC